MIKLSRWLLLGVSACNLLHFSAAGQEQPVLPVLTSPLPVFSGERDFGRMTGYSVKYAREVLAIAGFQPDVTSITQNVYSVSQHADIQTNVSSLNELPANSKVVTLKVDLRADLIEQAGLQRVAGESWTDVMQLFLDREGDYLFLSDGGIEVLCDAPELDCSNINKSFTHQKGTSYLAISKLGTTDEQVKRLSAAAEMFKPSDQYQRLVDYWLAEYQQKLALKMQEHKGIIRLWRGNKDS